MLPFLYEAAGGTAACRRPPQEWRKVLRSLGTTAPVCILLPFVVHGVIDKLLATRQLDYDDRAALASNAPVMDQFIRQALADEGDALSNMLTLLRAMLRVHASSHPLVSAQICLDICG